MNSHDRRSAISGFFAQPLVSHTCMLVLLCVGIVCFRSTLDQLLRTWSNDATFSHCFLISPICVWLAWQRREVLKKTPVSPSVIGVSSLVVCVAIWVLAQLTDVKVVSELALVAMVPALIYSVYGLGIVRALVFPLGFLFFLVPFGRGLVPLLMEFTADISTTLLRLSGIPVHRSNMFISIPVGDFEVAKACSGLNYFVTGLVLGVLYGYLTYGTFRKRLLCFFAFLVIPIIANGLRVYFTILAGHLTNMRFGPGYEHIVFGRIFFVVMIGFIFWIGLQWKDSFEGPPALEAGSVNVGSNRGSLVIFVACIATLVAGPWVLGKATGRAPTDSTDLLGMIQLPSAAQGWDGPIARVSGWRPAYLGSMREENVSYSPLNGDPPVEVYVAVYGLRKAGGSEMISYRNQISADDLKHLNASERKSVDLGAYGRLVVSEQVISNSFGQRRIWSWFAVGGEMAGSGVEVKVREVLALLVGNAYNERIMVISTEDIRDSSARLERFVRAHEQCVSAAFSGSPCR